MSSVKYNDGMENSVEQDQTAPKGKEHSQAMGATIDNESTTTEPPPKDGQQPKPLGLKCILLVPNFCPRFCCC